jgi:thioredoxin reductase (NADPH)
VVIASGARYRKPALERLDTFEGRGIWYWASPLEASLCKKCEVAVMGGGNSAGQAAVFSAQHASKVHVLVRGRGLRSTMSRAVRRPRSQAAAPLRWKPTCQGFLR